MGKREWESTGFVLHSIEVYAPKAEKEKLEKNMRLWKFHAGK
jgi:hypothetical protein